MLQATGLSYSPGPGAGILFKNINVSISRGEKVVLVGRNGAGKTKLLDILAGLIEPDEGDVTLHKGARVGYLPQDVDLEFEGTLEEFVGEWQRGVLEPILARLNLSADKLKQRYATLSIGERMRAALARVLAEEPTILLLDEPGNNLDIAARQWLQDFLLETPLGVLMVSHDRAMANAVADRMLDLSGGKLNEFTGGYDEMLRAKRISHENQKELFEKQTAENKRLKEVALETYRAAGKMSGKHRPNYDPNAKGFYRGKQRKLDLRAKAIRTRVRQLEEVQVEKPYEEVLHQIDFKSRPLRHSDVLVIRNLRKRFDGKDLYGGLNLHIEPGERIAILGPNGSGKTTLFRMLLGEEIPDTGEIKWSPDAFPLYLSQARSLLDLDQTTLGALAIETREEEQRARTILGCLRFRRDEVFKPVRALSVGERTKVELTSMMLSPANVLMLDEPTNHLDAESLEALENALLSFSGCVLFTSHDTAFVQRVATRELWLGS